MKRFKKIGAAILTGILVLSMGTGAFAKSSESKLLSVEVSTLVDVTQTGVPVEVQAVSPKKGSGYDVQWTATSADENVVIIEGEDYSLVEGPTVLEVMEIINIDSELIEVIELVDYYVFSATFTGLKPGSYVVTATVTMWAGKSHVSWAGENSTELEVESPATFENLSFVVNSSTQNGKSKNYNVDYTIYANYSDGSQETVTTASTVFHDTTTKDVMVTFEGIDYQVTVTR